MAKCYYHFLKRFKNWKKSVFSKNVWEKLPWLAHGCRLEFLVCRALEIGLEVSHGSLGEYEYAHDIIDDLCKRATDFMHQEGLHMDEDHVGKQQNIYFLCFISESNTAGVLGCPMCFTSRCCAGIRITEKGRYLTLKFCGKHHPRCHDELHRDGGNSACRGLGFRPY